MTNNYGTSKANEELLLGFGFALDGNDNGAGLRGAGGGAVGGEKGRGWGQPPARSLNPPPMSLCYAQTHFW